MGGKGKAKPKLPKELRRKSAVDDLTEAGTLLGAVGGAVIGATALTAWVSSGGNDVTVFDLIDKDRLYFLLLIAQLLALACAMISAIMLRSSNWPRERKVPWAVPLLAFNIFMIVSVAIVFVLLEGDYMSKDESSVFGPGPFLAIFGLMFSIVGALMFVLDTREKAKPRLKPAQRSTAAPVKRAEPVEEFYVQCPNCGEDVPDDSPICPNCRTIISDEGQQNEEVQDEDDLDQVQ